MISALTLLRPTLCERSAHTARVRAKGLERGVASTKRSLRQHGLPGVAAIS